MPQLRGNPVRIRSGPATVSREFSVMLVEQSLIQRGIGKTMDKSGDLHEKKIDPRETGLSMKMIYRQKYGLCFLSTVFLFPSAPEQAGGTVRLFLRRPYREIYLTLDFRRIVIHNN